MIYMLYKFCENHLADLYDAIKNNNIEEAQKVEHELTVQEECVACAYTFKAKGEVRNELLSFLKTEGFEVEARQKVSVLDHFYYWFVRTAFFACIYLVLYAAIRFIVPMPWSIVIPGGISFVSLLVFI